MTLLIWLAALMVSLISLPFSPWAGGSLVLLTVLLLAGVWAIGITASDRAFPAVLGYVIAFGVYCHQIAWTTERLNLLLLETPDPWPLVASAAATIVIPAAFIVSPVAQWIFETAPREEQRG